MSAPALSDYRALIVHERVPSGLFPVQVEDNRHDPHLRSGEWALVDPSDREIQSGELYLVWMTTRAVIFQVRTLKTVFGRAPDCPHLSLGSLNPRGRQSGDHIPADLFQEKVIGRVVALFDDPWARSE